jgi:hypothetical protein
MIGVETLRNRLRRQPEHLPANGRFQGFQIQIL